MELLPVSPRSQPRPDLSISLNPSILFASVLPVVMMVLVPHNHHLSLGILLTSSVPIVVTRASLKHTVALAIAPWVVTTPVTWTFNNGVHHQGTAVRLYDLGDTVTGGTGIDTLIALVLVSGASTDPGVLIRTLTATFRMSYRLDTASTAAAAFVTRFCDDFVLLRTIRTLRGVDGRRGTPALVVRWIGSTLPLTILTIQHAEYVALLMDSRASGTHRRRTEMADEPWREHDWEVVVLAWALALIIWNTLR